MLDAPLPEFFKLAAKQVLDVLHKCDPELVELAGKHAALKMQIAVTDAFERYALWVMAFSGAVASYLASSLTQTGPADMLRLAAFALLIISFACGLAVFMLGLYLAQARIGLSNSAIITDVLREHKMPVSETNRATCAMIVWQYRHLPWIDRHFLEPMIAGARRAEIDVRQLLKSMNLMASATMRQSVWMRVQLLLAVAAAICYVWPSFVSG